MKKVLAAFLVVIAGVLCCKNAHAIETFIPHITSGSADWADYLQVNNNAPSDADFTLTLYNNSVQVYSQKFTEAGLSHSLINLKALSSVAETGVITYTELGLNFRISYENTGGGLAEFKTMDTLDSDLGLYFSTFSSSVVFKGSAIANLGTSPAGVTLYAIGQGSVLGTFQTTLGPRDKIIGIHTAWFPAVTFEQIDGIIAVTDTPCLCGIVISGDADLSHLLFTPASQVSNFAPQTSAWDVVGSINMNGIFPATADAVLTVLDDTFSAEVTTKTIGGAATVNVIHLEGTVSGPTGTFSDQVSTITVGSTTETITMGGVMTVNGDTLAGSGTITSQIFGNIYQGTYTATGTRK
ncbi:MAG: hypothetical protein V1793_08525 [Pseudomonadota bacterium]